MAKVFLIKDGFFEKIWPMMKRRFTNKDGRSLLKGKKVAVKVHMGEYGNLYHIRPAVVGRVVEFVKEMGGKPFVFDTLAKYTGSRDIVEKYQDTARKNGFTEESIGCPVLILDEMETFKSKSLSLEMPSYVMGSDALIVISHGKGHAHCAGYGGAIKNIGMGMISPKSKADIHQKAGPRMTGKCSLCGSCVKVCPKQCIFVRKKWSVEINSCIGCGRCINVCPNKALSRVIDNIGSLLTEPLTVVAKKIPERFYITALISITKFCDCGANSGPPLCSDIGFLVSDDPVAIDSAAIDLIKKEKPKFFKNMGLEPMDQINAGEEAGLGSRKYELVEV
ncbi:MAG: DUF362 domain-containing protein [Candidatus Aenigmarchaeota archaeon]|nr:DUF362 domain-containing protein [Candidatus Aenigmarchaeota archaeon]